MATHSSIFFLGNPMDRGSWQATVHGVAKSQTQLSTHTNILLQTPFHYRLLQGIEYSSPCYPVGSCCLSILYTVACICQSQTPNLSPLLVTVGFLGGSMVKNLPANAGDTGLIPGSGRSSGVGNGNPLQYSCLGNLRDRGAWQATVHGVAKSQTQLK